MKEKVLQASNILVTLEDSDKEYGYLMKSCKNVL